MVIFADPEWVVLRHFIERGDRQGLSMVDARWFTGLARTTFSYALSIPELSMPQVIDALKISVDPDALERIKDELRGTDDIEDISAHLRTLAQAFNNRTIKDVIDKAGDAISQGHDRRQIAEKVIVQLSRLHEERTVRTVDDILEGKVERQSVSIAAGVETYADVGIERWQMGNLLTLAGDTGTYKTTTAVDLCFRALEANEDLHVYYFMKEQPAIEVWMKVFARFTEYGYTAIQREMNRDYPRAMQTLREAFTEKQKDIMRRFIVIDQSTFDTPMDVASMLRTFSARTPKMMWVVDYITRLDYGGRAEHFNAYYAAGLEVLKNAALHTQSFGILIAQLKDGWNIDNYSSKPRKGFPNRSHIIWSSELKNLSAYILMLYHPGSYFPEPREYLIHSFVKVRHVDAAKRLAFIVNGELQSLFRPNDAEDFAISALIQRYSGD